MSVLAEGVHPNEWEVVEGEVFPMPDHLEAHARGI